MWEFFLSEKRYCWKTPSIPWMTHGFRSMSLIARVACANVEMTGRTPTYMFRNEHYCSAGKLGISRAWWLPTYTLLAPVCCFDRNCHLSAGFCSPRTARANSPSSVQSSRLRIRIPSVLWEDSLWTGIHTKQSSVYRDSTIRKQFVICSEYFLTESTSIDTATREHTRT